MAERVQVQGLGDAVPGIQPTIQRAGQYSVGQRRASAVGRNKLMDLADALSQVNPMLQQYTQVADIEAEQFEDELSRKSPEEIQAMLQKTEGEFDKLSRKGAMSWLTSPINRKRKLEAVGNLSSRDLISQITTRLENPEVGDEDADQIIAELRDEYINKNPLLRDSVLSQGGLQQSLNRVTPSLKTNFDRKMSAEERREQGFATTAGLYDFIDSLKDTNTLVTGGISDGAYTDDFKKIWEGSNAHNATEQRAILKGALGSLARNGMQDEAEELRIWAASNLKFGTAKMTEMEQDELDDFIDDVAEQAEDRNDREERETVEQRGAEAYNALLGINNPKIGYGRFNGQEYKTVRELTEAVDNYRGDTDSGFISPTAMRTLSQSFRADRDRHRDPLDYLTNEVSRNTQRSYQDTFASVEDIIRDRYDKAFSQNPELLYEFDRELQQEIYDYTKQVVSESEDNEVFPMSNKVEAFIRKRGNDKLQELEKKYKELNKVQEEKIKKLPTTTSGLEPSERNFLMPETLEEKVIKGSNDMSVFLNKEVDAQKRSQSYRNLVLQSEEELLNIATGKSKKVPLSLITKVPIFGRTPYTRTLQGLVAKQFSDPFSQEERDEASKQLMMKFNLSGGFLKKEVISSGRFPEAQGGQTLDFRTLSPSVHIVLSKQEVEKVKDMDLNEITTSTDPLVISVRETAERMGQTNDLLALISSQKALLEDYSKIQGYTYPIKRF
ncbi:hypothetical protein OAA64_02105 [bacterium]|nr:hypothetical protein [bacterium]